MVQAKLARGASVMIAVILSLALMSSAQSQGKLWTLEECIVYAQQNSLLVQQSDISVDQQKLTERQAKLSRYPSVNASGSYSINFGRTIDPTTNSFQSQQVQANTFGLQAGALVYNGGRINKSIKQSKMNVMAAEYDKQQAIQDLSLTVARNYLNVLLAEEQYNASVAQREQTLRQVEQTEKLIAAGSVPRNAILDIEAQVALDEQQLVGASNAIDMAYLQLKLSMNLDPSEEMSIAKPPSELPVGTTNGYIMEDLYARSVADQPEIEAARVRKEAANIGVGIAKTQRYPSLTAFGNLQTNYSNLAQRVSSFVPTIIEQEVFIGGSPVTFGSEQDIPILEKTPYIDQITDNFGQSLGLSLQIPIFNNGQTQSAIERAELGVISAELAEEQLLNQLKSEVMIALADARAAEKTYLANQKTVASLEASFENNSKRYVLGMINTLEYTRLKNQVDNARISAITSKYDYLFKLKILDFYQGKVIRL